MSTPDRKGGYEIMRNVAQQSSTLALTAEDLAYIHELIAAEDVAAESRHLDEEPPKGILSRLVSIDDATVRSHKDAVITQMAQALRIARTTLETIIEHNSKNLAAKNSVRLIRAALAAGEGHEITVPAHPQLAGFATADEALRFRHQHGGWVFKPQEGLVLWFSYTFTPGDIFTHHATRGLNGELL
jgi:hypothetical protein